MIATLYIFGFIYFFRIAFTCFENVLWIPQKQFLHINLFIRSQVQNTNFSRNKTK